MTMTGHSLRRNFSWTIVGNVVYALCLWGIVSVLTKLGSEAVFGRYALASVVATPVMMFANLQLRSVLAADAAGRFRFGSYLAVRLAMLPLALVVVVAIALTAYSGEMALVIILFGVARTVEGVSDILYGQSQKCNRMDLVSRSLLIKGPASLVVMAAVFATTGSLPWAMVGLILAWVIPLVAFDLPQGRRLLAVQGEQLRPQWGWSVSRQIIWLALPLGLVMMLIQLTNTVPRTVLEKAMGEDAVGMFAALAYLIVAGSTVVMAMGQSSLSPLARLFAAGRLIDFRRLVGKLVLLGLGVGIAGVIVALVGGRQILTFIYTPEYGQHSRDLVIIMFAGGFVYIGNLLGPAATAMGAFRGQLVIQALNVVLLLGLALRLIPAYGLTGAAWTLLGGAVWVTIGFATLIIWKYRQAVREHLSVDGEHETSV